MLCYGEGTDVIVRLADTYLNFLFRPHNKQEGMSVVLFKLVSRVNMTSTLVERSAGRFGSGRAGQWKRKPEAVLESAIQSMHKAALAVNLETKEARLFCDWQAVLSVFEASETQAAQGRLESRIRTWVCGPQVVAPGIRRFAVAQPTIDSLSHIYNKQQRSETDMIATV